MPYALSPIVRLIVLSMSIAPPPALTSAAIAELGRGITVPLALMISSINGASAIPPRANFLINPPRFLITGGFHFPLNGLVQPKAFNSLVLRTPYLANSDVVYPPSFDCKEASSFPFINAIDCFAASANKFGYFLVMISFTSLPVTVLFASVGILDSNDKLPFPSKPMPFG